MCSLIFWFIINIFLDINKQKDPSSSDKPLLPALDEDETLKILKKLSGKLTIVENNYKKIANQNLQHMAQAGQDMPMGEMLKQFTPYFDNEYAKHFKDVIEECDVLEYELEDAIMVYCNNKSEHYNEDIARLTKSIRQIYKTFGGDIADNATTSNSSAAGFSTGPGAEDDSALLFDVDAEDDGDDGDDAGNVDINSIEAGSLEHFLIVLRDLKEVMGQVVDQFAGAFIQQYGEPRSQQLLEKFQQSLMQLSSNTYQTVLQQHNYDFQAFEEMIKNNQRDGRVIKAFQKLQNASTMALLKHGIQMM